MQIVRSQIAEALSALPERFRSYDFRAGRIGIILGSAWGGAIEGLEVAEQVDFESIPHLGKPSVQGHQGKILLLKNPFDGAELVVFSGRRHFYEERSKLPIAVMSAILPACGVHSVLLTNAAGSLRSFPPGSLMVISDHINRIEDAFLGVETGIFSENLFNPMAPLYDDELSDALILAAKEESIELNRGVYCALTGPSFETAAEVRMFGQFADAVGMSTVIEAQYLHAAGLRVIGLSCMTNWGAGISEQPLSHIEVQETLAAAMPTVKRVVRAAIGVMAG